MNARRVGTVNQSSLRKDLIVRTFYHGGTETLRKAYIIVTGQSKSIAITRPAVRATQMISPALSAMRHGIGHFLAA